MVPFQALRAQLHLYIPFVGLDIEATFSVLSPHRLMFAHSLFMH